MPNRPQKVTKSRRSGLKLESLEARQLLAGVTGAGTEVGSNIQHPNGNIYDQVLMTGSSVTVTADPGQVTRVSFLDASGDIVQAEFAGAGSLTVSLAGATGPAPADKYNQPGVSYMKGTASFTIQGSDATTNFGVFSVGTATANAGKDNPIFAGGLTGGNNVADIQRITIVADPSKPNGSTFGGIRAGNALFGASSGVTGISAAGVQVQDVVTIGDIDASGSAIPTLIFGENSQFGGVTVSGGDLVQTNAATINNTGSYNYRVTLAAGATSGGTALPASTNTKISFSEDNPFGLVNNTFNLTNSVDTIPGMAGVSGSTSNGGDDVINGALNATTASQATFTTLDSINGGAGSDTLNLIDLDSAGSAQPTGVTVTGVETVNVRAAGPTTLDVSTWTGVTSLNVTQATAATLTAPSTTAITAAGVTPGAVTINGGSTVSVTSLGKDVFTSGAITIGGTTAAAGAVTVTQTGVASTDLTGAAGLGPITVNGGTTVTINRSAGSTTGAGTDLTNFTVTEGAITVNGSDATTAVTVIQSPSATARAFTAAVTAVKESADVTFSDITAAGQTVIIDGLTFTAAKALTADQVAAAFSNLTAGTTQGPASLANGSYSGVLSTNWTSGAASGTKVTFTGATPVQITPNLDVDNGTATTPLLSNYVDGAAAASATSGRMGVVAGAVAVEDKGTSAPDSLTSVTLTGFGVGSTVNSEALSTLTLASSNEDVAITNTTATTLALGVNAIGVSTTDTGVITAPTYTTINVTATGTDSWVALTASSDVTLNVNGSKTVNFTGSTLAALKTLSVSETAGINMPVAAGTLESVNTTGTTGKATVTIDASKATYSGGAGQDIVTTNAGTPGKAISLGAGDDTLTLGTGTVPTSTLDGGDGTDTIGFTTATIAQTASNSTLFDAQIVNFEKVGIPSLAAGEAATVDLANLDDINFVTQAGAAAGTSAVKEVFTVTYGGTPAGTGETYIFDGKTLTYNDSAPSISNLVTQLAAITYNNWDVTTSVASSGTITFTNKTAQAVTDIAASDFTGTNGTTVTETPVTSTQGVTAVGQGSLTLSNMPSGGTLEITGTSNNSTTVNLVGSATGSADSLNLITRNDSAINAGTITAAGVETLNWTATDSKTSDTVNLHTLKIVDNAATSLTITGTAHVKLDSASSLNALAMLDASALNTNVEATTNGVVAETIKTGGGIDALTAKFTGDNLQAGAGNDTLTVNAGANLVQLTGGAGSDLFVIAGAPGNVNAYATITDPTSGDRVKLVDVGPGAPAETFAAAKLSLDASTAVFQDYANYAIANTAQGAISWFQFGGNTYVVEKASTSTTAFQNGLDIIVKLNGAVDLTNASFNAGAQTLMIV